MTGLSCDSILIEGNLAIIAVADPVPTSDPRSDCLDPPEEALIPTFRGPCYAGAARRAGLLVVPSELTCSQESVVFYGNTRIPYAKGLVFVDRQSVDL